MRSAEGGERRLEGGGPQVVEVGKVEGEGGEGGGGMRWIGRRGDS